ncbi:hypothetical protein CR513_42949, partial [Mucuna pruriens]
MSNDSYLLPSIDQLVDNALGIRMHPKDEEKNAFIIDNDNFCYRIEECRSHVSDIDIVRWRYIWIIWP